MNVFEAYREYLKDNPKGYWFKRKLYGYGWTPATWQGWLVIGLYLLVIFGAVYLSSGVNSILNPDNILWPIIAVTVIFLAIVFKTGESPKWQWGVKKENK